MMRPYRAIRQGQALTEFIVVSQLAKKPALREKTWAPSYIRHGLTKRVCNKLITIFLLGLALPSPVQAQITRAYHYECHLKDGSKFFLRAPYLYYPLAAGHETKILMTGGWDIFYQRPQRNKKYKAPASIPFTDSKRADCSRVGKVEQYPLVNSSYLKPDGTWFSVELLPQKFYLSPVPSEQPENLREQLIQIQASPCGHLWWCPPEMASWFTKCL